MYIKCEVHKIILTNIYNKKMWSSCFSIESKIIKEYVKSEKNI